MARPLELVYSPVTDCNAGSTLDESIAALGYSPTATTNTLRQGRGHGLLDKLGRRHYAIRPLGSRSQVLHLAPTVGPRQPVLRPDPCDERVAWIDNTLRAGLPPLPRRTASGGQELTVLACRTSPSSTRVRALPAFSLVNRVPSWRSQMVDAAPCDDPGVTRKADHGDR